MEDLEIKLKRQEFSSTATMGVMSVNGLRIADTLEDCQRKLPETCPYTPKGKSCKCPEKVYGETCIPPGRYKVIYRYSPKSEKNILLLKTCSLLGDTYSRRSNPGHTEGCILTGDRVPGREQLRNQFNVTDRVKKLVREAIKAGRNVWITIE